MSTCAHRIYRFHRYRTVSIRAALALRHRNVNFCVRRWYRIRRNRAANDHHSDADIGMTDLVVNSCHRVTIQIPIAMRSTLTPAKHPAVSSIGAYPTPAH
jgi:hypothetical protein